MNERLVKVYRYSELPKDSIVFSRKEILSIIEQMKHPLIKKWDSSFFPDSKFVGQSEVKAFHSRYRILSTQILDSCRDCNYEDKSLITYGPYVERQKMRTDGLFTKGYSRISNPVFVLKGRFAIIYEYNSIAAVPSWYRLGVYKRTSGGWSYFGKLQGGEF